MTFDADELDSFAPEPGGLTLRGPSGGTAPEPAGLFLRGGSPETAPSEVTLRGSSREISSREISVADVLGSGTTVHWDEAVAVVEELCQLLVSADGRELPVPQPADVLIAGDGAVSLRRSGRGERGPVEVGRMLHALLSTADVPVALRLFVTQATAPETHGSVGEFAAALAYFGKPGRGDLVKAIYDRFIAAGGSVGTAAVPARPVHEPPASKAAGTPLKRRRPAWLVPLGVASCLVGIAAWVWSSGALSGSAGGDSADLLSKTREAIADLGAGVRDAVGAGGTAPGQPAAQASPAAAQSPRPRTASRPSGPRVPAAASLAPVETPRVPAPPQAPTLATLAIPEPLVQSPAAPLDVPVEREPVQALYSSADADVSPPVLLYPQLPAPIMFENEREGPVNRMELVVSADGLVERVRLVNGPARMPDMMLLSGAKMWRFTPAVRNGQPVRYRAFVSWSGFP